jgi:hypothetical protein
MSNHTLKYLENCFNQPSQSRARKPVRATYPVTLTPEDVRDFEENSLLGMFWSKE